MKFSRPDKFRVRRLPRAQRLNFLGRRCCWLTGWWVFSSIQPNRYSGRTTTTTPKHHQRAGEWVVRLWERNGWLDGEKDEMVMELLVGWPPSFGCCQGMNTATHKNNNKFCAYAASGAGGLGITGWMNGFSFRGGSLVAAAAAVDEEGKIWNGELLLLNYITSRRP